MHAITTQAKKLIRAIPISANLFVWKLFFALLIFVILLSSGSLLSFQTRVPFESFFLIFQAICLLISSIVAFWVGEFIAQKRNPLIYVLVFLSFLPIAILFFITGTNSFTALRIHSLSSTSSIQGDYVSLNGQNFGDPWQAGTVTVGNTNFIIVRWENEKVVIKQPVTEPIDNAILRLCNTNNICDKYKYFTIQDPSTL